MPVSRARSTMVAMSPLRWGTMEAAGAKQRPGQVTSLLRLCPGLGCVPGPGSATQCPSHPSAWCRGHVVIPASTQHAVCMPWQSTAPTLHPQAVNPNAWHPQRRGLCSLPCGWVAPGLLGHAHALAHGYRVKSSQWSHANPISSLCAGRRLGANSSCPSQTPHYLAQDPPAWCPGHRSHSPRPPSMMPMELRLANPQSAKVVMLSARSCRTQGQGMVISAQEQLRSIQSSAPCHRSQPSQK